MSSLLCRAGPPATELLRPHPCPVQISSGQSLVCNINIRYFHTTLWLQGHAALFLPAFPSLFSFAASILFLLGPPSFSSQCLHPLHALCVSDSPFSLQHLPPLPAGLHSMKQDRAHTAMRQRRNLGKKEVFFQLSPTRFPRHQTQPCWRCLFGLKWSNMDTHTDAVLLHKA